MIGKNYLVTDSSGITSIKYYSNIKLEQSYNDFLKEVKDLLKFRGEFLNGRSRELFIISLKECLLNEYSWDNDLIKIIEKLPLESVESFIQKLNTIHVLWAMADDRGLCYYGFLSEQIKFLEENYNDIFDYNADIEAYYKKLIEIGEIGMRG